MNVDTERTYGLNELEYWPLCLNEDGQLNRWPFDGVALAVIGSPIDHSLSPVMHNAALAELAKAKPEFAKWRYFKFKIASNELEGALRVFHEKQFRGLNLTVPHKALVVPNLEIKDSFVQVAGAANTLLFTETWWRGYNTDGIGLSAALRNDLAVELTGAEIILLGAGGAARAAAAECLRNQCASLWIGNRTQILRDKLVDELRTTYPGQHNIHPFSLKYGQNEKLPAQSIVINATSLGLEPEDDSPLDLEKIPRPMHVFDMIYRPAQTALLRQAATLGIPNSNGLSMLVHQGAASLEIWTGEKAPIETMDQAVRRALN
ncbi:MAG TPA: shikimate dehydrogenase [Lacunisphaera sp.]|jgi:shikimate dehydrogenase